jgi:DNA primase
MGGAGNHHAILPYCGRFTWFEDIAGNDAPKAAVTLGRVLDRCGVELKHSGKEFRGRCPIHRGEGTDTCHASLEKNAFQRLSCHAKGNVLDFVAAMEKCSVRDAALRIQTWFQVPGARAEAEAALAAAWSVHEAILKRLPVERP